MRGILNGMVMQRNEQDVCEIYLKERVQSASYTGCISGAFTVEATPRGDRLTGMPVGGPYTVEVNGERFTDIYVGDLWVLGGQSNMDGVALLTQSDRDFIPDPEVRAYYMEGVWRPAKHNLHEAYRSIYLIHRKLWPEGLPSTTRVVGPGLSFGQEMKRYSGGVPQGLLCAAHSGTSMAQWSPDLKEQGTDNSLYAALLDRFECNGSHVKGMFWYQGCSDAGPKESADFSKNMIHFIEELRADFGNEIPIVQVQIGSVHHIFRDYENTWNSVRMQQYQLNDQIDRLDTITALNKDLDDYIHLSNEAQIQLGKEAAESMAHLIWPTRAGLLPAPRVKAVWIDTEVEPDFRTVCTSFENLHGNLRSEGRPWGLAFSNVPDFVDEDSISTVRLKGNVAMARTELQVEELEKRYLFYGWGQTTYCNLTDEAGRGIPAFGPICLEKQMEKTQ